MACFYEWGDMHVIENYRVISIQIAFSKIIEKLAANKFMQ